MIIQTIWTENEGSNVDKALRYIYKGTHKKDFKGTGTLIKHAIRDFIEIKRMEQMKERATCQNLKDDLLLSSYM